MTFLQDVFVPDRQQLLIPTIMVGFIIVLLIAGASARSSGLDRTFAVAQAEGELKKSLVEKEHGIFRDHVSYELLDRQQQIGNRYNSDIDAVTSDFRAIIIAVMLQWTYNTPLYVLMPSSPEAFLEIEHEALLFPRSEGYFMSENVPKAAAVHLYREEKTTAFTQRVNNDMERNEREWTLEQYRAEIDRIMNVSYDDPELRSFLENSTGSAANDVFEDPLVEEHVRAGTVKQVGIIHFLPAIFANFLLYYLLFGILTGLVGLITGSEESAQEHQARRQTPSQNRRMSSRSQDRS